MSEYRCEHGKRPDDRCLECSVEELTDANVGLSEEVQTLRARVEALGEVVEAARPFQDQDAPKYGVCWDVWEGLRKALAKLDGEVEP